MSRHDPGTDTCNTSRGTVPVPRGWAGAPGGWKEHGHRRLDRRPARVRRPTRAGRSSAAPSGPAGSRERSATSSSAEISPERSLDAEVGEVQVLLVDDRRDPRVDLDHVVADELDVEEVLDLELGHDPVRDLHQRLVLERDEVHREPRAHRLARLRVPEQDALAVGDAVDRALAAGRELHHEQVRPTLGGQQLDRLLEPHRDRPGPLVEELVGAVDGRDRGSGSRASPRRTRA